MECPEAGRASEKHTLESKGSSREEKGASRSTRGIQKHGCGNSAPHARTGLASENCTRYSGQGHIGRRHKLWMPKSRQGRKMLHHRVWCAPSRPERPGLGHWGTWTNPSQQAWGNCQRRQQKGKQGPPPEWGSFVALAEMAETASTPMVWCVVAAAIFSTIMGLRISEATTLKLRHINGLARRVTFWDQKINHKWYTRPLSDYGATWAMLLHYAAAKKLGHTPDQFIFSGTRQLERIMAKLRQHSTYKTPRWH